MALGIDASGVRTIYVPADDAPPAAPAGPCGPTAPASVTSEPDGMSVVGTAFGMLKTPAAGFCNVTFNPVTSVTCRYPQP